MFRIVRLLRLRLFIGSLCFVAGVFSVRLFEVSYLPHINLPVASSEVLVVGIRPRVPTAAENRDLSLYDFGGEIKNCAFAEAQERKQCLGARDLGRKFVYDHWRSKTRGYIAVEFPCDDCLPIMHIFIEPDREGQWRIVTRLEDARYGVFPRTEAFDVRFRPATEIEMGLRESTTRVLAFLDTSGKEIDSY